MWQLLMVEDETACITCPVRPVRPFGSFLGASQFLECERITQGSLRSIGHRWPHVGSVGTTG